MKIRIFTAGLALFIVQAAFALNQGELERFFPPAKRFARLDQVLRINFPDVRQSQAKPEVFNQAVDFNNQGLAELRNGNANEAEALFSRACKLVPGEKGFWNNLLLATRKIKGNELRSVDIAKRVMALDNENYQAAHIAGLVLLNDLDRPLDAIAFLNHAFERSNQDASIAVALATAYEKAGYSESAFEILKLHAHRATDDPYPIYLLGLQYLEREDFNPAIRAFNSARAADTKGYAHDAWIRARYYAGQLEGLADDCRKVLRKFPEVMNRQSLERILFSLASQDFRFEERVKIKINDASAIERLDFLVRPIPELAGHQTTRLASAEIVSGANSTRAQVVDRDQNGRLRISVPRDQIRQEFILKLVHRIQTVPLLGSQVKANSERKPEIKYAALSEKYSVENDQLALLADRIERQPGNFVQMATKAVSTGLKYLENYEDFSVEWALRNPDNCDCTEFSRLLAALCLRKDTPARMATGFLVKPELMGQETSIGHAWCEVFFPGRGWIPIDPTLQSTMHWAYFGNLLSDQIYFGEASDNASRISIDYTSTRSEMQVNLSGSFIISRWQ
ncbi:MAG: transglutaminase domain-containing protein [Candidatus Riflebacteria bacterium]